MPGFAHQERRHGPLSLPPAPSGVPVRAAGGSSPGVPPRDRSPPPGRGLPTPPERPSPPAQAAERALSATRDRRQALAGSRATATRRHFQRGKCHPLEAVGGPVGTDTCNPRQQRPARPLRDRPKCGARKGRARGGLSRRAGGLRSRWLWSAPQSCPSGKWRRRGRRGRGPRWGLSLARTGGPGVWAGTKEAGPPGIGGCADEAGRPLCLGALRAPVPSRVRLRRGR